MNYFHLRKIAWVVMFLFFIFQTSQVVVAQETKPMTPQQQPPQQPQPAIPPQHTPPTIPNQTQPGTDWQSVKQDFQNKYLRMMSQIDSVKSAAAQKKISDPQLTDAFNKFQSAAQDFDQLLQSGNKTSPEQMPALKSQLDDKLNAMTAARDHVLDVYSKIGGGNR